METNLSNQIEKHECIDNHENDPIANIKASSALITNIELPNGKVNSIVTIFNGCEFDFEELNIGITKALYSGASFNEYISREATLYSIRAGKLKEVASFPKVYTNQKCAS